MFAASAADVHRSHRTSPNISAVHLIFPAAAAIIRPHFSSPTF